VAERISRQRARSEGWLSLREVREATGLGHATAIERFTNATRDGLRVARLETGEWRLHPDDLERIPRRYEDRGAPRNRVETLAREVESLRAEIASLRAALGRR
jgi:hypothetical protein